MLIPATVVQVIRRRAHSRKYVCGTTAAATATVYAHTRARIVYYYYFYYYEEVEMKKKISVFIRFIIFNNETSKWHRRSVWRSADDVEDLIRLDVITPSACAYVYNIIYMMITYTSNIQYIHNMYTLIVIYANPKRNPFFSFPRVVKYSNIMLIAV